MHPNKSLGRFKFSVCLESFSLGICSEVLLVVQESEEDVRAVESENDEGKRCLKESALVEDVCVAGEVS